MFASVFLVKTIQMQTSGELLRTGLFHIWRGKEGLVKAFTASPASRTHETSLAVSNKFNLRYAVSSSRTFAAKHLLMVSFLQAAKQQKLPLRRQPQCTADYTSPARS